MGPADGAEQVEQIGLGFVGEAAPFEAGIGDCRQRDPAVAEHEIERVRPVQRIDDKLRCPFHEREDSEARETRRRA